MPVTVPKEIGKLARSFRQLATPESTPERAFLAAVRDELKPEIRKMYAASADPFGSAWMRTKSGRPAYQSKKMANAIALKRIPGGLEVHEWVKWIRAADEGHTWPPRQQAQASRFFDKNGRRIGLGPLNRRALRLKFVEERTAKAHSVGQRVLPARRQQPDGRMPNAWGEAANRGAEKGMTDFIARATGNG